MDVRLHNKRHDNEEIDIICWATPESDTAMAHDVCDNCDFVTKTAYLCV